MAYLETKSFEEIFNFTRPTSKWVFNQQGQLIEVPAGQPAFEYDPVTGEPRGILIEEARTNLNTFGINRSLWTTVNTTISDSGVESPLKGVNWTKIQAEAVTNENVRASVTNTSTRYNCVGGVYFSGGNSRYVGFRFAGSNNNTAYIVDCETSQIVKSTTHEDVSAELIDLGHGVFLLKQTVINNPSISTIQASPVNNPDAVINSGLIEDTYTGQEFIYVLLADIQSGSELTSPIITNGTQVTRAADVGSIDDLSPWFNPNEGTFVIEWVQKVTGGSASIFALKDQLDRHILGLQWRNTGSYHIIYFSDSDIIVYPTTGINTSLGKHKASVRFSNQSSSLSVSIDGSPVVTVNDLTDSSTAGILRLGQYSLNNQFRLNSTIVQIKCIPHTVSDAELQELSTL